MLGSMSLASSGHLTPHGQPGGGICPRFKFNGNFNGTDQF
jgi:hypothetical protein